LGYSCYYFYQDIFNETDPMEDGIKTIDEALEERLTIGNKFITNIFFNAGWMYQDVVSFTELKNTDINYHNLFGIFLGDFLIRIFWRRSLVRVFSYIPGNPNMQDIYFDENRDRDEDAVTPPEEASQ